jgi:hypothetical protein
MIRRVLLIALLAGSQAHALDGIQNQFVRPPDTQVAVGANHIVEATNAGIRVWLRNLTVVADYGLTGLTGCFNAFDPRVVYDASVSRWYFLSGDKTASGGFQPYYCLGVSKTNDPTGDYYYLKVPDPVGVDYPDIGYSTDKVLLRNKANKFEDLVILNKQQLLAGQIVSAMQTYGGDDDDARPVRGVGGTTADVFLATEPVPQQGTLRVIRFRGVPPGAITKANKDLLGYNYLPFPGVAEQAGTSVTLDIRGGMHHAVMRQNKMWVAGHWRCGSPLRLCLGLVRVDGLGSSPFNPSVGNRIGVSLSGVHLFYPALGFAASGNAVVAFNGSNSTQYAAVYVAEIRATDPIGVYRGPFLRKAGLGPYAPTSPAARWGDYSGVAEDPLQPGVFWIAVEYPINTTTWGTWLQQAIP